MYQTIILLISALAMIELAFAAKIKLDVRAEERALRTITKDNDIWNSNNSKLIDRTAGFRMYSIVLVDLIRGDDIVLSFKKGVLDANLLYIHAANGMIDVLFVPGYPALAIDVERLKIKDDVIKVPVSITKFSTQDALNLSTCFPNNALSTKPNMNTAVTVMGTYAGLKWSPDATDGEASSGSGSKKCKKN